MFITVPEIIAHIVDYSSSLDDYYAQLFTSRKWYKSALSLRSKMLERFTRLIENDYKKMTVIMTNGLIPSELTNGLTNARRHGLYEERYFPRKELRIKTFYINGKINGDYWNYAPSGKIIAHTTYKNGKIHGFRKSYYRNTGDLQRLETYCEYSLGKKNGKCEMFYPNGSIRRGEYYYKDDKLNGECKVYRDDGGLFSIIHYKDDELYGEYISYWINGSRETRMHYSNGVMNGEYQRWDIDGRLIEHSMYKNGQYHGLFRGWVSNDKSGKIVWRECEYDHGVILSNTLNDFADYDDSNKWSFDRYVKFMLTR